MRISSAKLKKKTLVNDFVRGKCSIFAALFGVIAGRKSRVACYVALER